MHISYDNSYKQLLACFYFHLQQVQRAEEVKNDKCEEVQRDGDVTLQSVKEPQAETSSIDNEVLQCGNTGLS